MAVIVLSLASLVGIVLGGRILWRLGTGRSAGRAAPSQLDDRRLERMEQAIDAIAIEVERISEAQRFSAAVLAERLPARGAELSGDPGRQATSLPRSVTPH